ncbi:hypothetical protein ACFW04_014725 [Cataglyphis niger]
MAWCAEDLVIVFLRALLNLIYQYTSEIQIPDFINIKYRQMIRICRRHQRDIREDVNRRRNSQNGYKKKIFHKNYVYCRTITKSIEEINLGRWTPPKCCNF